MLSRATPPLRKSTVHSVLFRASQYSPVHRHRRSELGTPVSLYQVLPSRCPNNACPGQHRLASHTILVGMRNFKWQTTMSPSDKCTDYPMSINCKPPRQKHLWRCFNRVSRYPPWVNLHCRSRSIKLGCATESIFLFSLTRLIKRDCVR